MAKFTLVIRNHSLDRNHSVTTHKTYDSALNRAKILLDDGVAGCSFAINGKFLSAEDVDISKDSSKYHNNAFV